MESADGAEDLATVHTLSSKDPYVHIFVGNLAFTTTEQDLRQLFEPSGTVDTIRMMTDRETGRSCGFGFVEMPDSRASPAGKLLLAVAVRTASPLVELAGHGACTRALIVAQDTARR